VGKPGKKQDRLGALPAAPVLRPGAWEVPRAGATPEESFRATTPPERRRRLGQFFTPEPLARLMARWVAGCNPRSVLDPAAGPGVFVRAVREQVPGCRVTAVDVDPVALDAARAALHGYAGVDLVLADFLTWDSGAVFDAILANPPYLKHHDVLYDHDVHAEVGARCGVRLSRLTNLYALFIVEACRRLRPGGRAAILVPGEWTNANFGDALKAFLIGRGLLKTLVYYSHASTVFEDALTTASVLLLANDGADGPVTAAFVDGDPPAEGLAPLFDGGRAAPPGVAVREFTPAALLAARKWDHLLRHGPADDEDGWVPLSALAATQRGIATGANRFFHVPEATLAGWDIRPGHALPCVGRALDVDGVEFDDAAFRRLAAGGARAYLLDFGRPPELTAGERAYLARGEAEGLPARYLLAGRRPWYAMESRPPSPIWAAVFGRKGLRFVRNLAGVRNLTAFHCIYPRSTDPAHASALASLLNRPDVAEKALRHVRVYGGGLRKVEPRDLLDIRVPDPGGELR